MVSRVRIDQNKASLVQSLIFSHDNPEGVFDTYADVMAFAAAVGKKYDYRLPLETIAQEPNPISYDIFISRGYDLLVDVLTIMTMGNLDFLSDENSSQERRITLFEQYANGGLSYLQEQLTGAIDYQERLLLLLDKERHTPKVSQEFDLSRFL
ncbi:DNA phosphorothioation-associated protein 4 [Cyanobacterium stanieri LEGE 03274]|uniref:DNA phosphorothioation-associated protein 4 n=1 Tax=Cyanobacterium stanieri LEGE 03274 TaxID=1828756 RepID=A0ABR9V725_9CHRO|nr:DNA phosphorothioation-associated protein 4 [Cyanobacterium stanieri]MBE9223695.1 DNA phosphorothioation-associated protein 4 [Cyanobacterium stanieri LEGE 03274]